MPVVKIIDFDEPLLKKKNVCAYARVSSMKDTQETSLDIQIETYSRMIISNPEWNFMGVFADQGKSGTNTYYRDQFNLMLELAETGNLDMIITKSISRFARNVVDCLSVIQNLKNHNTEVWFERENISSFDPKVEFVITVLAGMAEEESRNISENVRWNIKKRYEQGHVQMATAKLLGYERDKNNKIIINKKEAQIVRKIYDMYLAGYSQMKIAEHLNNLGLVTKFNKTKWYPNIIHSILTNEKYTGNAVLQKSFRSKIGKSSLIRKQNIVSKYYVENSHPAIIEQKQYDDVQKIFKERQLKYNKTNNKEKLKMKFLPTIYSGYVKCGKCGKSYNFKVNHPNDKYRKRLLVCSQNRYSKKCSNDAIFADIFDEILIKQVNKIIRNKTSFLNTLRKALTSHPTIINLKSKQKETQQELRDLELKIKQLETMDYDNDFSIRKDLDNKLLMTNLKLAKINNLLLTTYNVENIILHFRSLLKPYKNTISDIKSFPFKNLFNTSIVYSRERVSLNIIIDSLNKTPVYSFSSIETKYLIRKTEITTTSEICIY